jgi:hypothetical protein
VAHRGATAAATISATPLRSDETTIVDQSPRAWSIHKEVLLFERIEAISDPMRELIEDLWPELVHKLRRRSPPVRRNQSSVVSQFEFKLRHYPEFISGDRGADMC